MEDTVIGIIREMIQLKMDMHGLMHTMQEKAIYLAQIAEGFPGRLVLDGHLLIPVLDPISGDNVPIAVTWKNLIATQEGIYQDAYLGFQQSIDRGFGLVERLQAKEGIGSYKSTQFVGMMDRSSNFVSLINNTRRTLVS